MLDRATADAVEHSTYLRAFADFEVRTTTGGGLTWKGRYLKGQETYIEFFSEGDLPGQDALFGSSGLALSVENQGELATVTDRLKAQGISDPAEYDQTRDFGDGVPVPWFDTIRTTGQQYDAFDPGRWSTGRSTSPTRAARPSPRATRETSAGSATCPTATATTRCATSPRSSSPSPSAT